MKTAFFIFELAETASVTAETKSQLYTFAYTVSPEFGLGILPAASIIIFSPFSFKFLESMEIQCLHTGPVICIPLFFIQTGSTADSKRFVQGFYPFLLAPSVTEDAKGKPVNTLLLL